MATDRPQIAFEACDCGCPWDRINHFRNLVYRKNIAHCPDCYKTTIWRSGNPGFLFEPELGGACPLCSGEIEASRESPCTCHMGHQPCGSCENAQPCCDECHTQFVWAYERTQKMEQINGNEDGAIGLDVVAAIQAREGMKTAVISIIMQPGAKPVYATYKVPVGMELAKDDQVVIPRGDQIGIGKVSKVHDFADLKPGVRYRWILTKLDTEKLRQTEEQENRIRGALEAAEVRRRAEEAMQLALQMAGIDDPSKIGIVPLLSLNG